MPYTAKQRAMFNARAKSDPQMAKLAEEANAMAKAGNEKPPVKKAAAKKAASFKPERPTAAKKATAVKRTPRKAY